MGKHCINCGTELTEGDKFCLNCGTKTEIYDSIQQTNPLITPKKLNTKFMALLVAAIIIIIVFVIVIIFILGGNSENRFIGSWTIQSSGQTSFSGTMIFEGNGDLKAGYTGSQMTVGKWSLENNRICLEFTILTSTIPKVCCTYVFSNAGNTLTIFDPTGGDNTLILAR